MGRTQIVACVIVGLWAAGLVGCSKEHPITVGSKNFTEQVVLGEIVAQRLRQRLRRLMEPRARRRPLDGRRVRCEILQMALADQRGAVAGVTQQIDEGHRVHAQRNAV